MKLTCPTCGTAISAENVNIQKTLAVCNNCGHVFNFGNSVPSREAKQRKFKKPEKLNTLEDDDRLELSYTRIFGPNDKIGLLVSTALAIFLSFISILAYIDGEAPPLIAIIFNLVTIAFWYMMAMFLSTITRIAVDDKTLAIKTGPLPFPIKDDKTLALDEITEVFCEETEESKSRAALDRYYRVCARFSDGNRVAIVKTLPQDFAFYIAQVLNEQLQPEEDMVTVEAGDEFYSDAVDQDEADDMQIAHLLDSDDETSASSKT